MNFLWIVLILYLILILWLIYHWLELKKFEAKKEYPKISFSILIPFRNEEDYLERCINSILNQNYPKENIEIIAINDHSDDRSEEIIKRYVVEETDFRLINLTSENGKKQALEKGVSMAKHEWIVTTDADCITGKNWIKILSEYIQESKKKYVVMPVVYHQEKSLFEKIQSLEFLTLVATSAACIQGKNPLISNGANVAFSKEVFNQVNGFTNNKHISSGDDVFLLHKIHSIEKDAIGYLHHQEAMASTKATSTLQDFIKQRVRWGGKARAYKSKFSITVAALILAINLSIILTIILALSHQISWQFFTIFFLTKFIFDTIFILISTPFYGKQKLVFLAPILAILYPIYIFVISFLGFIYQPSWKGRKINSDK